MRRHTRAWLRIKKQIDADARERTKVEVERAPAVRPVRSSTEHLLENPKGEGEGMAKRRRTAKQRAATKKMIAARKRKTRGGRRRSARRRPVARRRRRRMRANPVAKTAAGRRRQRAASRRNIKKAIRARRRTRRVSRRVGAIRKAAGRGGIRLVRVKQASTPIVIEEKPRRRKKRSAALLENPRRRTKKRRKAGRRRRRYSANAASTLMRNEGMRFKDRGMLGNPLSEGALLENQSFGISAIRAFGIAGLGVGLGLVVADAGDRFVATRKPTGGRHPYFGANAAAAQNRRPDAWRLGAQAAGGVAGVALAYAVRGRMILPFLVGGTAVGFFANLTKMLINWYAMPMVLKVDPAKPESATSFANRMYPLEQKSVQDVVDGLFENFAANINLNANQQETPQIAAVLPVSPTGPAYTLGRRPNGMNGAPLGKARAQAARGNGRVGQPVLVATGRLGVCSSCGGEGGCWDHCPDLTLCGDCGEEPKARCCEYTMQPGDNIGQLANLYGIDVNQIAGLNNGQLGAGPGSRIVLPYAMCRALEGLSSRVGGADEAAPIAQAQQTNGMSFGLVEPPEG
jgi:hypothetical protein